MTSTQTPKRMTPGMPAYIDSLPPFVIAAMLFAVIALLTAAFWPI